MSMKLLLIATMLFLAACGGADGRRRRGTTSVGINGLTADELTSFQRLIQNYKVDSLIILPKNGDQIKYGVTYRDDQETSFLLNEGPFEGEKCLYSYGKAEIHESLIVDEDGKLTDSQLVMTPVEPTYRGNLVALKNACEKARSEAFPKISSRRIDIAGRLVDFKQQLLTHFSGLIDICRGHKNLEQGRCLELKINRLKLERAQIFTGSLFNFDSLIRTPKGEHEFKAAFTLNFAHFYFGGLVYQDGASGVHTNDKAELSKLEVLCLNESCN